MSCTATNQPNVTSIVARCTDAACDNVANFGSGSFGATGNGQELRLHVLKSGSTFVFSVGSFLGLAACIDPPAPGERTRRYWASVAQLSLTVQVACELHAQRRFRAPGIR